MRYFQISESDLETLEQQLPEIIDAASVSPRWNDNKTLQEASAMLKKIASDVRWNYGPPEIVKQVED